MAQSTSPKPLTRPNGPFGNSRKSNKLIGIPNSTSNSRETAFQSLPSKLPAPLSMPPDVAPAKTGGPASLPKTPPALSPKFDVVVPQLRRRSQLDASTSSASGSATKGQRPQRKQNSLPKRLPGDVRANANRSANSRSNASRSAPSTPKGTRRTPVKAQRSPFEGLSSGNNNAPSSPFAGSSFAEHKHIWDNSNSRLDIGKGSAAAKPSPPNSFNTRSPLTPASDTGSSSGYSTTSSAGGPRRKFIWEGSIENLSNSPTLTSRIEANAVGPASSTRSLGTRPKPNEKQTPPVPPAKPTPPHRPSRPTISDKPTPPSKPRPSSLTRPTPPRKPAPVSVSPPSAPSPPARPRSLNMSKPSKPQAQPPSQPQPKPPSMPPLKLERQESDLSDRPPPPPVPSPPVTSQPPPPTPNPTARIATPPTPASTKQSPALPKRPSPPTPPRRPPPKFAAAALASPPKTPPKPVLQKMSKSVDGVSVTSRNTSGSNVSSGSGFATRPQTARALTIAGAGVKNAGAHTRDFVEDGVIKFARPSREIGSRGMYQRALSNCLSCFGEIFNFSHCVCVCFFFHLSTCL